jgi:hypothetical protein
MRLEDERPDVMFEHSPHPASLTPAALLDEVHAFLGRFIAYPSAHAQVAHALWCAHAHLMDAWDSTPRIAFLSPEKQSGKSRALELSELLVPRPIRTMDATAAYLFRRIGGPEGLPTLLYDEVDAIFGPKASAHEELRALLNAGHRRGAVAGRCVLKGKDWVAEDSPAYCAVALAGIGDIPDTIMDRCVAVKMRRRAPHEIVEPYRERLHRPPGEALRGRLAAWAYDAFETIRLAIPLMPEGVNDRPADVWEPLLAVADAVGGDWPERARAACVALVAESREKSASLGVRLLADLRRVFGDRDMMRTTDILIALNGLDEAPWGEITKGGKPLTDIGLSNRLRRYEVKPKQIRVPEQVRGYERADFADAWLRYLPPL